MAITSAVDLFSLKGKVALVTGASSGLGAHFAHVLARAGADVILAARRFDKLKSVVESIQDLKKTYPDAGKATAVALDVSAGEASVRQAIDTAWATSGRMDILVNNAGVFRAGPFLDESVDDWDLLFGTNVKGLWLVAKLVAAKMSEAGHGGSIINISSCVGNPGAVVGGVVTYAATKATVQQLTRNLALELGKFQIRVNSISPGVFPSEMSAGIIESAKEWFARENPVNRIGDTEKDLDGPLLLLASDAGAYVTGTNLTVDGGVSLLGKTFF